MSMLTIGLSGLMAYQSALDTTANNLENALTPGYNRRVLGLSETNFGGRGFGVNIDGVQRLYDEFLVSELRNNISAYNHSSAYLEYASRLDSYLANENSSINTGFVEYFSSLQNLIADPASITGRDIFINQSNFLTNQFHNAFNEIENEFQLINLELFSSVDQINSLTQSIADINGQISGKTSDISGLLDQRDILLANLSEITSVYTSENNNGSIDVYLESGDLIVLGSQSYSMDTTLNEVDARQLDIVLKSDNGSINITGNLTGGRVGGLIDYRENVLSPSLLELNRLALVVSDSTNKQHNEGLDLNNELGDNFFRDINNPQMLVSRVFASSANVGNGEFSVRIDDGNLLKASDYQLKFTSPNDYTVKRLQDNVEVASGTISGFPEQVSIDGFTMDITSGSFNKGDRFIVSPLSGATNNMTVEISDPNKIAMAVPVRVEGDLSNIGNGGIKFGSVTDISNSSFATSGQLSPPMRIEFLSDTSYQIVNASTSAVIEGPITFDPNTDNAVFPTPSSFDPGFEITIFGAPQAGDQFNISYNEGASGDNRNGQLLGGLQSQKLLNGGASTFQDSYNRLANVISTKTNFADMAQQSSEILLQQSQSNRDAVSGVNMDEEVANLLLYQQAYQASAQLIAISDSIFKTLFEII